MRLRAGYARSATAATVVVRPLDDALGRDNEAVPRDPISIYILQCRKTTMHPPPTEPIKLYRHSLSGHSHRAEMFIRMLGLPVTLIDLDLGNGEHRQPAFLKLNRFGQVPVIDDGGTVVADSNAILTYLALRYAPEHWVPREPLQAARVQQWLSQAAGALSRGAATARAISVFRLQRDSQAAVQEAHWLFERIDATLVDSGGPWLAGGALPTIADIAIYTYTAHAPEGGVSLDGYPALRDWLLRVEALPAFLPMVQTPSQFASPKERP